ncbi:MAG: hypothetical protein ACK5SX_14960 [Sandaracinobacter sp.]
MGQFLWLERVNPELRLLDHFCQFLSGDPYIYGGSVLSEAVSYSELLSDAALMCEFDEFKSTRADVDTTVEWLDVLI